MSDTEAWVMNKLIKLISYLPIYIAIVVTLTLLTILFGFPFLEGD